MSFPVQPAGPAPRTGLLLAAGIIAIVLAAPMLFIGAAAFTAGGGGHSDGWGDLIAALGAVLAAIGTVWLVAGIGGVLRRQWGRVLLIICNSLLVLLAVTAMVDDPSGGVAPLAIGATGLGLAAFGQPRRTSGPSFTPMAELAPGWRNDPYGRFQLRYWNGATWTEQVATGGRQQIDPLGASPVIPFSTPRSAFEADDDGTSA